jgi:aspartate aminotransferase-like enzyme
MINHRGPEFAGLISRAHSRLQQIFETKSDIVLLTASGTGAMEAAIVNTLSPGDRVLGVTIGVFGDRFCQVAQAYGANLVKCEFPLGAAADPEVIRRALAQDPAIKAVLVTHNETSTGVTNDLEAIARAVREFDKLLLVDAVSSLGCIPVKTDAWGCDVVVTASQKGFMVPPGLAFAAVGPRAWAASQQARMPRFYFDFARHKSYFERGETPWTPALSVLFGLDVTLERMLAEGMPAVHRRHAAVGHKARDGLKALGLKLFAADERYASNAVTAVQVPPEVKAADLLGRLRTEHGVVLAGGQGPRMEGKVFRIGHMGFVSEADIDGVLGALRQVLPQVGFAAKAAIR